jgi:tetratricopeptide (TPR) repeat protein
MDNSIQRDEMLVRYIDGLMSAGEKAEFEKNLSEDAVLRADLENLQVTKDAVRSYGLKQNVSAIHTAMMDEFKEKVPVKNISGGRLLLRRVVAVAASIIFIFLVAQGWIFYNLSAVKVFDANYIQYIPDGFRGGEIKISDAQKAYQEKDYKKVIRLAAATDSINDNFLAAHSQLALNNAAAAVSGFKKVIAQSTAATVSELKDAAEYNLALAYVKNKDYDLALDLMNKIKDSPGHLYHNNITGKLVRQVKMLKWR